MAEYLDRIAVRLAFQIEQRGFRALPVPSTSAGLSEMRLQGLVSHKLAANLAGLGWIGKSCMLLTRDHGPRVRWVTVLTDAPLVGAGTPQAERDGCKSCSLCVDLCPAGAFTGIPFKPTEPVEARFDTRKCHRFLQERQRTFGARSCGICVYVCPHGWSMKRKRSSPRTTPALLRERLSGVVSTTTGAA